MFSSLVSSGVSAAAAAYIAKEYCETQLVEMIQFCSANANVTLDTFTQRFGSDAAAKFFYALTGNSQRQTNSNNNNNNNNNNSQNNRQTNNNQSDGKITRIRDFGALHNITALANFTSQTVINNTTSFINDTIVPLLLTAHKNSAIYAKSVTISPPPPQDAGDTVDFLLKIINTFEHL